MKPFPTELTVMSDGKIKVAVRQPNGTFDFDGFVKGRSFHMEDSGQQDGSRGYWDGEVTATDRVEGTFQATKDGKVLFRRTWSLSKATDSN